LLQACFEFLISCPYWMAEFECQCYEWCVFFINIFAQSVGNDEVGNGDIFFVDEGNFIEHFDERNAHSAHPQVHELILDVLEQNMDKTDF